VYLPFLFKSRRAILKRRYGNVVPATIAAESAPETVDGSGRAVVDFARWSA
jgi:hypothetical protein